MRDWTPKPAVRSILPLLIGLSGPPGAGKTLSALMLALGIQSHRGGDIILLDTDGDRALAYAPREGEKADNKQTFDFQHITFLPPFGPTDFIEAIEAQLPRNPACIIVDAFSEEHEGEGGVLWQHEAEIVRMTRGDDNKRDQMTMGAWIKPKAARRATLNKLMKIKTPIILTFQAREKTRPIRGDDGKTRPTNIGWTPISPPEVVQSMTLFCLLPIRSDGVPMWRGGTAYEGFTIKLPLQFRGLFPEGKPLDPSMGAAMSRWAAGGDLRPQAATPAQAASPPAGGQAPIEAATPASEPGTAAGTPSTGERTSAPADWDHAAWSTTFQETLGTLKTVADFDAVWGDESNRGLFEDLKARDEPTARKLHAAANGMRKALMSKTTAPQEDF